ncbi:aminotransferase class IV [Demequina sp. TTPB684]|uniref:aminotransferase class IV n=1 Tax=unclassified Demequina TaxID=2620311 RepID=UPI001CF2B36F|nr:MULTISPECIES: aminotransferase class IV [unclassified Demequina]MCB2414091.1 aminotransferase class IV [Demequina sp. TTPB684]UPU89198.1 aminotransferase class IV [Demequina sp. TMPB413]
MSALVWVDGTLHPASAPVIQAGNHGVTVGDGVFETLAVRGGEPFALTRHLVRLQYSLDRMGMQSLDMSLVRDGVRQVLDANGADVSRLRITVISGQGPMGSVRGPGTPNIIISGGKGNAPKTCRAVRAPWQRNERSAVAGVKSTSYAENVVMVQYATKQGADESLMSNTYGYLCEGTGSNVFIERHGEVVTPPLSSGCLAGITRGLILEWGAKAGMPVRVAAPGELKMTVLEEVRHGEAFAAVSSSTRGLAPVVWLDGADLGQGSLLRRLADLYESHADVEHDPPPPRQRAAV